ncbi:MAG: hypothetical protein GYB31_00210 [Bacteroidetes bacterium]|nr:hypothetical protein [Bacteroidota bacterium]
MNRNNLFWSILGVATTSLLFGCVQFKTATLYSGVEQVPKPERVNNIGLIVEPVIYKDSPADVWGLEKDVCQEASLTSDIVYSGSDAIQLSWNRNAEGCKFAGIGIGWDGYAGKDLSEIMDYVAIQMFVRSQEGRMFGLPIVLTLEDYSGGMGFAYTGNKYFERSTIDEEWQKVVVPLNAFDLETENLDPSNIKQLQLELQQSGSIYLDDISLVFYEPEPQEPWLEEEPLPDPTALPVAIFSDSFINDNGWGLMQDDCQEFKLSNQEAFRGNTSIYARWNADNSNCMFTAFGASWNKWHPVDMKGILNNTGIEFRIKSPKTGAMPEGISIGFEDYDRNVSKVKVTEKHLKKGVEDNGWILVIVPISEVKGKADMSKVKHLIFSFEGSGEAYFDEIKMGKTDP